MTARIAEGASGVAVAAGAAIVDAATTAGAAVAGAADGVKAPSTKRGRKIDAEKAEYAPKVQEALRAIEATRAQELLGSFQESPLPLTEANAAKVKSAFPIPREQTVVWADAEFDLRPSGIAMTEKGVYIKADADAFGVPGELWPRAKVRERFGRITEFLDGPADNIVACYFKAGHYTDDSAQAFVVLNAIEAAGTVPPVQTLAKDLIAWLSP